MHKCEDGTCKASDKLCPRESYCPPERPSKTDLGECLTETLKDKCPNGDNIAYCQQNGMCYFGDKKSRRRLEQIPRKLQWFYGSQERIIDEIDNCDAPVLSNGCPDDKPYKCPDGRCLVNNTCAEHNAACPEETPHLCHNGRCYKDNTCNYGNEEEECDLNVKKPCKNGRCINNYEKCDNLLNCPENKPFKCADDRCVSDPSYCPVNLFCDADKVKINNY